MGLAVFRNADLGIRGHGVVWRGREFGGIVGDFEKILLLQLDHLPAAVVHIKSVGRRIVYSLISLITVYFPSVRSVRVFNIESVAVVHDINKIRDAVFLVLAVNFGIIHVRLGIVADIITVDIYRTWRINALIKVIIRGILT